MTFLKHESRESLETKNGLKPNSPIAQGNTLGIFVEYTLPRAVSAKVLLSRISELKNLFVTTALN